MTPHAVARSSHDKFQLLSDVVDEAGLWTLLEQACQNESCAAGDLAIVIKPDLALFGRFGLTGVDPELVEALIDLLNAREYSGVTVASARDASALWLANRDPLVVAELCGYRFRTSLGNDYNIENLDDDVVEIPLSPQQGLATLSVGRLWSEAHFRISFAKNRSDEQHTYALNLHNLLHVMPLSVNPLAISPHLDPGEMAAVLIEAIPVHFALIDAFTSGHGSTGKSSPRRLDTRTIIAGRSVPLVDWVGAVKMGVDPFCSEVHAPAIRKAQALSDAVIVGSLAPYAGWQAPGPLIRDSVHRRSLNPVIARVAAAWTQMVDRELFPFLDPLDDRVNLALAPVLARADDNRIAHGILLAFGYWLSFIQGGVEAAGTLYKKDNLPRLARPVNVEPGAFATEDFDALVGYLEPLEQLVHSLQPMPNGIRWQYMERSVLFESSRTIDIPFDEFVANVDISAAIRCMNDYIGGSWIVAERDASGRVSRQLERNLYLPQPNYLVLYGGKLIDVTKIELARYERGRQRLYWRTVKSDNGSAQYDDGIVTFEDAGNGRTAITIMGRQEFELPVFWQVVNLDAYPGVKDPLVMHAYDAFFTGTMANFEAVFDGRDVLIGRPHTPATIEDISQSSARTIETFVEMMGRIGAALNIDVKDLLACLPGAGGYTPPAGSYTDEDGFVHVPSAAQQAGAADARARVISSVSRAGGLAGGFLRDLGEAVRRDMEIKPRES